MSNNPADDGPAKPGHVKEPVSWGEKRDRRRRRRKLFEEALGWILVPAMIYGGYLILQAVGGIPKELQDFAVEVFSALTGART
ncbi:MAG: hypothetical protein NTZ14_13890 [Hyphomicrobiales bacterium]|nr:hypothetical protein [Hyphomicrobiales bacterium]